MEKMKTHGKKVEGLVGETREVAEAARWWAVVVCILIALGVMSVLNGGWVIVFAVRVYLLCAGGTDYFKSE